MQLMLPMSKGLPHMIITFLVIHVIIYVTNQMSGYRYLATLPSS